MATLGVRLGWTMTLAAVLLVGSARAQAPDLPAEVQRAAHPAAAFAAGGARLPAPAFERIEVRQSDGERAVREVVLRDGSFSVLYSATGRVETSHEAFIGPVGLNRVWTEGRRRSRVIKQVRDHRRLPLDLEVRELDGVSAVALSFAQTELVRVDGRRVTQRLVMRPVAVGEAQLTVNGEPLVLRGFRVQVSIDQMGGGWRSEGEQIYVPVLGFFVGGWGRQSNAPLRSWETTLVTVQPEVMDRLRDVAVTP